MTFPKMYVVAQHTDSKLKNGKFSITEYVHIKISCPQIQTFVKVKFTIFIPRFLN